MTSPLTVAGSLNYPIDTGQPATVVPLSFIGQYDNNATAVVKVTGTGTMALPFGTVAMAKGLLVKVDTGVDLEPVIVRLNGLAQGADGSFEVSPGGMLFLTSPAPVDGVVSVDVDWTTENVIRFWVFG